MDRETTGKQSEKRMDCLPIPSSERLKQASCLPLLAVLALAALLFFGRLGERALWSEEVRWAEIPREMQLADDYLWPTINGKTYYDKPLGSYWLVVVASWMRGGVDETAARLPCAFSGLLGVALIMLVARRLFDQRTAVLAGTILATSFSFVFFSRTASSDVENVTGVLAALWLFLRNESHPAGWWVVPLWLIMALTSLTKGLLGFVLPILVIGLYCSLAGASTSPRSPQTWFGLLVSRNRWLFNRKSLLAIPVAVLVYLLPFLLSHGLTHSAEGLQMVFRENIRRFYDPVNHRGPVWLYAGFIFLLMAPWSLLLPAALVRAHQRWRALDRESRGERFALVYFWGLFVFFTLSSSRRGYYLLPILPAGSLLLARLLADRSQALGRIVFSLLSSGYLLIGLVSLLSVAALLPVSSILPAPWDALPALPCRGMILVLWILCAVGVCLTMRRFDAGRMALSLSLIAGSFVGYLFLFALPGLEGYRTRKQFANEVLHRLGSHPEKLALYHDREIVFYLGLAAPVPEYQSASSLARAVQERKVNWLIVRRQDLDACRLRLGGQPVRERSFAWESAEQRQHKLLLLAVHANEIWP